MFGHFQRNTQILRLIRLEFGWEESDKSGVIGRIVLNHSAFRKRNDSRVAGSSSRNAVSFFIRTCNKTLTVVAMRVSIPSILFKQFLQLLV
jgi:hypothetical protein